MSLSTVRPPDPNSDDLFRKRRWQVENHDDDGNLESTWYEPTLREALLKVHKRVCTYEVLDATGRSFDWGPALSVERAKKLIADEHLITRTGDPFDPAKHEFRVGTERRPVTPGEHGKRTEKLWHVSQKCAEETIRNDPTGFLVWGPGRSPLQVEICRNEFWPCKCVKE